MPSAPNQVDPSKSLALRVRLNWRADNHSLTFKLLSLIKSNPTWKSYIFTGECQIMGQWKATRDICLVLLGKTPWILAAEEEGLVEKTEDGWKATAKWGSIFHDPVKGALFRMRDKYDQLIVEYGVKPEWTRFKEVPRGNLEKLRKEAPWFFEYRALKDSRVMTLPPLLTSSVASAPATKLTTKTKRARDVDTETDSSDSEDRSTTDKHENPMDLDNENEAASGARRVPSTPSVDGQETRPGEYQKAPGDGVQRLAGRTTSAKKRDRSGSVSGDCRTASHPPNEDLDRKTAKKSRSSTLDRPPEIITVKSEPAKSFDKGRSRISLISGTYKPSIAMVDGPGKTAEDAISVDDDEEGEDITSTDDEDVDKPVDSDGGDSCHDDLDVVAGQSSIVEQDTSTSRAGSGKNRVIPPMHRISIFDPSQHTIDGYLEISPREANWASNLPAMRTESVAAFIKNAQIDDLLIFYGSQPPIFFTLSKWSVFVPRFPGLHHKERKERMFSLLSRLQCQIVDISTLLSPTSIANDRLFIDMKHIDRAQTDHPDTSIRRIGIMTFLRLVDQAWREHSTSSTLFTLTDTLSPTLLPVSVVTSPVYPQRIKSYLANLKQYREESGASRQCGTWMKWSERQKYSTMSPEDRDMLFAGAIARNLLACWRRILKATIKPPPTILKSYRISVRCTTYEVKYPDCYAALQEVVTLLDGWSGSVHEIPAGQNAHHQIISMENPRLDSGPKIGIYTFAKRLDQMCMESMAKPGIWAF